MTKNNLLVYIYKNYRNDMFLVAYGVLKDHHLSEDIIQDCILAFEGKYDLLSGMEENELAKYVYRTTKNKSLNYLRYSSKVMPIEYIENSFDKEDHDLSINLVENELINSVISYLKVISEQQAKVFTYRFVYSLNNDDIANKLNISNRYVRVLMYRARKNLQIFMPKESCIVSY